MHSPTSRAPSPSPRARGSTISSRSLATSSLSRTQRTQPAGAPSSSAIHAASRAGSCVSAKRATIPATRTSKRPSQPYSSAYRRPWRPTIQPRSPGRGGRRTTVGAAAGSRSRRTSPSAAASRSRSMPSSRASACSAERRSRTANASRPAGVRRTTWRRPSAGERSRATRPRASSRPSRRLRWPASIRIRARRSATSTRSCCASSNSTRLSASVCGVSSRPGPSSSSWAV